MIDPMQAFGSFTPIPAIPTPTSAPTHVVPIPTVIPDPAVFEEVHETGTRTLWVVFIAMLISSAVFAGLSWKVPVTRRLFHIVTTLITIVASLSYFAMASGHGTAFNHIKVRHSHPHVPDTFSDVHRQIFWARYVDWLITTPLLLLDLGFLAGLNGAHILMAVAADIIMVLTGLFASFGQEDTPQKWGWYTIGLISYLVVIWHFALHGRATALARGDKVAKLFGGLAVFTFLVWTAYPIVWAFGEGSRRLSVDGEIIAYAVLDLLAKVVFGAVLLHYHRTNPDTQVEIGGFWAYGLSGEGSIRIADDEGA